MSSENIILVLTITAPLLYFLFICLGSALYRKEASFFITCFVMAVINGLEKTLVNLMNFYSQQNWDYYTAIEMIWYPVLVLLSVATILTIVKLHQAFEVSFTSSTKLIVLTQVLIAVCILSHVLGYQVLGFTVARTLYSPMIVVIIMSMLSIFTAEFVRIIHKHYFIQHTIRASR